MQNIHTVKSELDSFDSRLRELSIRENEAAFAMYRGLEHEDLNELEAEISRLWLDPETVKLSETKIEWKEFYRQFELLRKGVLKTRVEGREEIFTAKNDANQQLVDFKLEIDGEQISRTDLGELMRFDTDPTRRKRASCAYVPLEKELHKKVLDLIDKRNAAAKNLGFESFPHLAFALEELDLDEVIKQLQDLLERGNDAFRATLDEFRDRDEVTKGGLLSSDLNFIHENYLPNLPREIFPKDRLLDGIHSGYSSIGIDLDKLPIKTVIQDIPAGGFCFTFDPGKDVRILANPRDGQMWYQVMLHEFGHAVQGSSARGDGHYFVALSDPSFFWEGIAVTFEKLGTREVFLRDYIGDEKLIREFLHGAKKRLMHRIRSLSVSALFEYSLYLEPASYEELGKRRSDMTRKYHFVEPACDPPSFTCDIFQITHPCYIQNYVIAEMIAAQLLDASDSTTDDPWTEKLAGRIVKELLVPGGMITWREKIRKFTDSELSPDALVKKLY